MLNLLPDEERPREKLLAYGCESLSDAELLAILIRTGNGGRCALTIARHLLTEFGSIRGVVTSSIDELCAIPGVGEAKYAELQAAFEIIRRHLKEVVSRINTFTNAESVKRFLTAKLRDRQQEVFAMLTLDTQHRLIDYHELFFGTVNAAAVYPRELVKLALKMNAAAVILIHNHPSGVAEPSDADKRITKDITQAMQVIDIQVLDHFVVGDSEIVSFAQRGWI